jgi:hypothetical protein
MSWRADRFANMLASTGKVSDPLKATELQTKFFLAENPELTKKLQNASSVEEAHGLLSEAWRYAGYNRPGTGEHAKRLAMAQAALPQFTGQGRADAAAPGPAGAPTPGGIATATSSIRDEVARVGGSGATPPTTPDGRMVALTGGQSEPGQPVRVAAAGGNIPVPLRNVPDVAPPHPDTANPGTTTQKALAQQQAKYGLKLMLVGGATGNKGVIEAGKAAMDLAKEYLKPTEIERTMTLAGIDPASPQGRALLTASIDKRPDAVRTAEYAYPGQPNRQQQAVAAGMPDHRPEVVRVGEAAQDTPGLVRSGIETEAARKGADTTATSRATATTEQAAAASSGAQMARQIMPALDDAEKYFKQAAAGGGTGAIAATGINRTVAAAMPFGQAHTNEIARQNFEKAIATVTMAKSAIALKGQGPVSNFERTLAAADLPAIESADPSVGLNAFARLRRQLNDALELDRRIGLHAGESGTPPQPPNGLNQTRSGVQWKVN